MSRRKAQNIITDSDYEELKKSYKFIVDEDGDNDDGKDPSSDQASSWKDRMVQRYHRHLYKTHVIADLTQYNTSRIGLRWRTEQEVIRGKGVDTCGNKHCPFYDMEKDGNTSTSKTSITESLKIYNETSRNINREEDELGRLRKLPYGVGLNDYEVHFSYEEQGETKEELVKLRLCLRCAPKLFYSKGGALGALMARQNVEESVDDSLNAKQNGDTVEESVGGSESRDKRKEHVIDHLDQIESTPSQKRQRGTR